MFVHTPSFALFAAKFPIRDVRVPGINDGSYFKRRQVDVVAAARRFVARSCSVLRPGGRWRGRDQETFDSAAAQHASVLCFRGYPSEVPADFDRKARSFSSPCQRRP